MRGTSTERRWSGSKRQSPAVQASSARRARALLLALACGLSLSAASMTDQAQAALTHSSTGVLAESSPGAPLEEPTSVAIDHASGQIFVGDEGEGTIDVYSSSGAFQAQFGEAIEPGAIAIDEASGDIYVAEPQSRRVLAYRPEGSGYQLLAEWSGAQTPGGGFGEVTGVAFDNGKTGGSDPSAGDLYVLESEAQSGGSGTGEGAVDVYQPKANPAGSEVGEGQEGTFLKRLAAAKGVRLEEPGAIVVDSKTGELYVGDAQGGFIATYSSEGAFLEKLTGKGGPRGSFLGKEEEEENIEGLAVEESSGDVYVGETERHAISQYDAKGEWVGETSTGTQAKALGEPRGVAVSSTGALYGADPLSAVVDIFGPAVLVPGLETGKAQKITRNTALLGGTVNGEGSPAKYSFQWGPTQELGNATSLQSAGTGETKASATIEGLSPGTTYYFRIIAENQNGTAYGLIRELQTPQAVTGSTGPVKELGTEAVTLTGSLSPEGIETHYYFQWGLTTAYGGRTQTRDAGSPSGSVEAQAKLEGLSPNTTYHYRLVGENSFGSTDFADRSLTTSGPPRITNEAPTGLEHNGAAIYAKVNADQLLTKYRFQWGETSSYGHEVPVGGASIGEGASPTAVQATLTGLRIGTVYHYRVLAENSAGTTEGIDETFQTIPAAPVDQSYVTNVSTSEATLGAAINPLGNDTHVYFQYGTANCAEAPQSCNDVPQAPGDDIGAGTTDVAQSEPLTGLTPETTYYYRAIASNVLGATEGPEKTFQTKAGETPLALADDRSWEVVSPPDKHGAPIEPLTHEGGVIRAAENGAAITYVANGSIEEEPEGNRSPEQQQVISTRTPGGWTSQDIATPNNSAHGVSIGVAPEYQFFSPDLSTALVEPFSTKLLSEPPLAPEARQSTIYLRDDASGAYLPLVTEANVAAGVEFGSKLHFVAATPDLSHVVMKSPVALTGPGSGPGLYEWSAGKLQFVSPLPDGAISTHEVELGYYHIAANAVSSDGSRLIWTTLEENAHRGHLYMHDTNTGETIQLDAAQRTGEPAGIGTAQFETASSDGSRVFFTDKQRLTADSTAEPAQGTGKADLYECEITESAGKATCDLHDLTVDHNENEHAAVQNLLFGASEDGAYVYFVAQGVLADNANGQGQRAQPGADNLYVVHLAGQTQTTSFIASLAGEDKAEWEGELHGNSSYLTARVSPNGQYLAFMSSASLTGYDNRDLSSGDPDEEVYLYDATSSGLTCVSCNPSGARPSGVDDVEESGEGIGLLVDRRRVWVGHWLAGNIPGWTAQSLSSALLQSRYLTDSGRLFFNSPDDLVPQAKNGKEDVYEYEPSGVGSCASATGGCVSLISGGSSERESSFLEATPTGDDVFFLTQAQLVPQDTDTAFDIYDARVCSEASPCLTPPPSEQPPCGSSAACRPAEVPQLPTVGPSRTETVSGPASNAAPPPPGAGAKAVKAVTRPKPLTRARKLAKALTSCRKQFSRSKSKRKACEAHARKLYGPKRKGKKARPKSRRAARSSTKRGGR